MTEKNTTVVSKDTSTAAPGEPQQSAPQPANEQPTELTAGCQDYYCHNQQQNPHTPRVMKSLGLAEADVDEFCTNALFPKIA